MNNEKLVQFCENNIGRDFTEYDSVGCADTVNKILKEVLGYEAGGGPSTNKMYKELQKNKNFKQMDTYTAEAGDLILSPTGYGNGTISNGHVGILGSAGFIYSNNSSTSKLDKHLTAHQWKEYFKDKGGYPVTYWRAVGKPLDSKIPKVIQSSKDPTKISLTAKGTLVSILVIVAQQSGLSVSQEDISLIADNLVLVAPLIVTIWGVIRKYL